MEKEYVVTFPTNLQITEDSWIQRNPALKVTGQTTVAEIEEFYREHNKGEFMQVQLVEMTSVKPKPARTKLPTHVIG